MEAKMRWLRGSVMGTLCVIVVTVVFVRGMIHVTTPNIGTMVQVDASVISPSSDH